MGESDPMALQPSKPVCDWSVGPVGGEVKGIFPAIETSAVSSSLQTI